MERERPTDPYSAAPAGLIPPPAQEASVPDALHQCEACGQTYDLRNLGLVLHHQQRGHAPRPSL